MINLLQKYIQINTAHPDPDYHAAVQLFEQQAIADGFTTRVITLPSQNPVLVVTYQGSNQSLPALALHHHMDTVPANNPHEWSHPPFQGVVVNDQIFGRGTQDMKGVGVVHYAALQALKKQNIVPQRTIHFIMVPDEEVGGFHGTKELIEHPLFAQLNIGYVIDEGISSGDLKKLYIKISERTPIQIKVTSAGNFAHASDLHHKNCLHELISFLSYVVHYQQQQKEKTDDPGTLLSMQITNIGSNNESLNIIPSSAHATVDIRVPAQTSMQDALAIIENFMKPYPALSYQILATSEQRCSTTDQNSKFYLACAQAITENGLKPQSLYFQATTDSRFYSSRGIETLGLTPFYIAPNLHGTDESIYVQDLILGEKIISKFIQKFCVE